MQAPVYCRELSGGTLTVTSTSNSVSLDLLFDIAERRNPKRAFLFVSKVLGRHIPVSPSTMRNVYRQLAQQIPAELPEPVMFIGMAETAVGLAAGVFQEMCDRVSEPVFLTSTRHPVDGDLLCEFKENHSHATDHLIYQPVDPELRRRVKHARSVVLIDDEATTGNTFINLLQAFRDSDLNCLEKVVAVTLTDWSGTALAEGCPLPVTAVSLITGELNWFPTPGAPVPVMPACNVTARGSVEITTKQDWGRLGMAETRCEIDHIVCSHQGEKVLVLGTGEFVWQPFLFAENLENAGAIVKFGSVTRSPIAQGLAIESVMSFSDNYGLGIPNFLYNVAHQYFDRIILCVETPETAIDPLLIEQLSAVAAAVEVVVYE